MASSTISLEPHTQLEDVLECLPRSSTITRRKGQHVYDPAHRSQSLYLVVRGTVGLSHIAEEGSEVLLDVIRPDEVFGESAFLDVPWRSEQATALEEAELMTWAISGMENLLTKRPRLGVALLQIVAQRNAEYTRLIESFSHDSIDRRLARSLLRFSGRLGTPEADGSVRMMPFTHSMLARYVGTSRELVSQYMGRFRKLGYLRYSREAIFLNRVSLQESLDRGRSLLDAAASPGSDVLASRVPIANVVPCTIERDGYDDEN
jgi:CRP-like cAMP-binding protein